MTKARKFCASTRKPGPCPTGGGGASGGYNVLPAPSVPSTPRVMTPTPKRPSAGGAPGGLRGGMSAGRKIVGALKAGKTVKIPGQKRLAGGGRIVSQTPKITMKPLGAASPGGGYGVHPPPAVPKAPGAPKKRGIPQVQTRTVSAKKAAKLPSVLPAKPKVKSMMVGKNDLIGRGGPNGYLKRVSQLPEVQATSKTRMRKPPASGGAAPRQAAAPGRKPIVDGGDAIIDPGAYHRSGYGGQKRGLLNRVLYGAERFSELYIEIDFS